MEINIEELTIKQIKDIARLAPQVTSIPHSESSSIHPMVGRRCLIRTYSAGVHIGDVVAVNNGMEVQLKNALRLWKWEGGGLSLSAVANNGIKGGRLNKTGEVYLTNAIEFIPTSSDAEKTFTKFIEDEK